MVRDILVETTNPEFLDQTVQHFGAAVVGVGMPGGFVRVDNAYIVRCFGDSDFVKFAIENQGYGKVVKEFDGPYSGLKEDGEPIQAREGLEAMKRRFKDGGHN